jgi:SNF2 family DNA or RNA helicase
VRWVRVSKTIIAIAVTGALAQQSKIRRVLIVAPLSIVGVWQEEFAKFADFPYSLQVLQGSGTKKTETLKRMTDKGLQIAVVRPAR